MHRKQRIATALHQEIALVVRKHISDPRLQNITITHVKLSDRLDYADVSFTHQDTQRTPEQTVKILQEASSKIRYYLSKRFTNARYIQKLRFHYDNFLVERTKLYQFISQIETED